MEELSVFVIMIVLAILLTLGVVKSCELTSDKEETKQTRTYQPTRID